VDTRAIGIARRKDKYLEIEKRNDKKTRISMIVRKVLKLEFSLE